MNTELLSLLGEARAKRGHTHLQAHIGFHKCGLTHDKAESIAYKLLQWDETATWKLHVDSFYKDGNDRVCSSSPECKNFTKTRIGEPVHSHAEQKVSVKYAAFVHKKHEPKDDKQVVDVARVRVRLTLRFEYKPSRLDDAVFEFALHQKWEGATFQEALDEMFKGDGRYDATLRCTDLNLLQSVYTDEEIADSMQGKVLEMVELFPVD